MNPKSGEEVAKWISDNPGTGLVKMNGAADFPGDKEVVRYALVDRWGAVVAIFQKVEDKGIISDSVMGNMPDSESGDSRSES